MATQPWPDFVEVAFAAATGAVFLWVFYTAIRVDWPEHYFATTDFSAYAISSSPFRYAVFRFAPVFVTCTVVAVTLDRRSSSYGTVAALLVVALHGFSTLGIALYQWARSNPKHRGHRASIAFIRAVALVGVFAVAIAAALLRPIVGPLVPGAADLNATLWTAGFAGIAGAFVVQFSRTHGLSDSGLLNRALNAIPKHLRELALEVSAETGADPDLVLAVMTVENLQRPPWFRRLERLKSRIMRSGTYGIMQVASKTALSDEDSIRIAVSDRFANVRVKNAEGTLDLDALGAFAEQYNGGPTYVSTLSSAYYSAQTARVRPKAPASSKPDNSSEVWRKSQCMFCSEVLRPTGPIVGIGDEGSMWGASLHEFLSRDVALAHIHCFAAQHGIQEVARLKRGYDAGRVRADPASGAKAEA